MKAERFVFPALLIISLITYFPALGSGFVFDFVGWQRLYNQGSFPDIVNCFGYKGNQQVYHLFFYTLYRLFHLSELPWYLFFCSLHAFNGWLLFHWVRQLKMHWRIEIHSVPMFLMAILFIVHPYAVEVVVFKACVHYLVSLSAVLGVLILAPRYFLEGAQKSLLTSLVIFFLSLFALEISYVTPLVMGIYSLIYFNLSSKSSALKKRMIQFNAGLWGLLVLHLLINRLTLGAWIGHYGASTHLRFDFMGIISTEVKYLAKHFADARMYGHATKTYLFDVLLSGKILVLTSFVIGLGGSVFYFSKIRKLNARWHLLAFSLLASILFALPVSNLFFYYLGVGTNDRFSYVPLAFSIVAMLGLFSFLKKPMAILVFSLLIVLQLFFQQKILHYWHESTKVLVSLKADYRWHDRSHVFVLNSPDNYKGVWMTTMIKGNSGIDELIDYQTPKENKGIMYDIYQFNMNDPNDGVKVEQTGPMQLKVTFNQWGNWWHLHGIGGGAYENEYYKAEPLDYPYQVTFKQFPPGSAIIYQDSMKWKEFVMDTVVFRH